MSLRDSNDLTDSEQGQSDDGSEMPRLLKDIMLLFSGLPKISTHGLESMGSDEPPRV